MMEGFIVRTNKNQKGIVPPDKIVSTGTIIVHLTDENLQPLHQSIEIKSKHVVIIGYNDNREKANYMKKGHGD